MKTGVYTKKKINFKDWEVDKFPLTFWNKHSYLYAGCGFNALATIVGKENPYAIRALSKDKDSCVKKFFFKYLKSNGFKVLELTKCHLSNKKKEVSTLIGELNSKHILVTTQILKRNECSYFVNSFSMTIHNQIIYSTDILDFVNFPIYEAFLITHPTYK